MTQTVMEKQKIQTVMKYQETSFGLPLPTLFSFPWLSSFCSEWKENFGTNDNAHVDDLAPI